MIARGEPISPGGPVGRHQKHASGMEARQGGDGFGSVHDSPAPKADAENSTVTLACRRGLE
jgi:hypothetical protein